MLVQFKFNNYKCFKDEVTLNLVASNYFKDEPTNIYPTEYYSVVNSLAVYGANASGKTKLFQAFNFMREMVLHSANNKNNRVWQDDYDPFRLNVNSIGKSSSFEVVFLIDNIQYRYGFEVNKEIVITEWLFRKKGKEVKVMYRDDDGVEYNKVYINRKVVDNLIDAGMIRNDALLLSILSLWNDSLSSSITRWFYNANVLSASINNYMGYSLRQLDGPMKKQMLSMLNGADICIDDMNPSEVDFESIPDEIKKMMPKEAFEGKIYNGVKTTHKVYDSNGLVVGTTELTMENDESYGTTKLFALSAPIIDTLKNGKILWVDEIDHGLHYDLLVAIIRLFHSPETNPHNAQLIINTHNSGLLDAPNLFRRDQIYIASKNRYGESSLKPITNYSSTLRKSSKLGHLYREGKLGGVPYLGEFDSSVISKEE
ncbi:MAG: ATP-binding protein [Alistipes sp.]|nr:ATP-binding protein [Alistipes sp.]